MKTARQLMRVSKQVPEMFVAVGVFGLFGALLTLGQWTLLARVVTAVFLSIKTSSVSALGLS